MSLSDLPRRLWQAQERSFLVKLLLAIGSLAGAVAAILGLTVGGWRIFFHTDDLYSKEYDVVEQLRLGVRQDFLTARLGEAAVSENVDGVTPGGQRRAENGEALELLSYPRPGYVVTALVDEKRVVVGLAVTSCGTGFQGTFRTPVRSVVLNRTLMADLGPPENVAYSVGGSGGFSYFVLDTFDGGYNARDWTDMVAGRFYLCGKPPDVQGMMSTNFREGYYTGSYQPSFDRMRAEWPINIALMVRSSVPASVVGQFIHFTELNRGAEGSNR